jgi:hypothetical protein
LRLRRLIREVLALHRDGVGPAAALRSISIIGNTQPRSMGGGSVLCGEARTSRPINPLKSLWLKVSKKSRVRPRTPLVPEPIRREQRLVRSSRPRSILQKAPTVLSIAIVGELAAQLPRLAAVMKPFRNANLLRTGDFQPWRGSIAATKMASFKESLCVPVSSHAPPGSSTRNWPSSRYRRFKSVSSSSPRHEGSMVPQVRLSSRHGSGVRSRHGWTSVGRLFLNAEYPAAIVEFDHAVALGKDRCPAVMSYVPS